MFRVELANSVNVDACQFRPGPICHESLSPPVLKMVKAIYVEIGPYLGTTLEQFELGFMRDKHPENEVAIWCNITMAWLLYHATYLVDAVLPDEVERKLLGALREISSGVEDASKLKVPVSMGRRLLQCYADLRSW